MKKAVLVFSGGLDSVCAAAYLRSKYEIYGITFSYGQRTSQEIRAAKHFAKILHMKEHEIIDIRFMKKLYAKTNALTYSKIDLPKKFDYSIVVPIRNAVFLSIASAWAFSIGATVVAYGAHKDDKRYPDCRPEFSQKLEKAFNSGEKDGIQLDIRKKITIWSPYKVGFSKSYLLKIGYKDLQDDLFDTWSCYSNTKIHCGRCESCNNRKLAFDEAMINDETRYGTP
ncbi:MAG: 7-cyano-7-deazaguanine synthase [Nitrosopumilaceae archaeon]